MKQEQVKGLFALAGIDVLRMWELPNQYWPDAYVEERKNSPWWLVKTPKGLIEIGWRKRVISIRWDDTPVRRVLTDDDVTKDETMVHAWGYGKALAYLTALAPDLTPNALAQGLGGSSPGPAGATGSTSTRGQNETD